MKKLAALFLLVAMALLVWPTAWRHDRPGVRTHRVTSKVQVLSRERGWVDIRNSSPYGLPSTGDLELIAKMRQELARETDSTDRPQQTRSAPSDESH